MIAAALIPGLTTGLLWIVLVQLQSLEWRRALLRAALLASVFTVALIEALSLFDAVQPVPLLAGWLLLTIGLLVLLVRARREGGRLQLPRLKTPLTWFERLLFAGCVLIAGVTLLVALRTPPQTWDSLNYHMARVAHWAQMGAVQPYATGIEVQNSMPPGPGMLVLQLYVLASSDALVNLVGWASVILSALGACLIAAQLGVGRQGQLLAALVALTIPMAIVQASTTMTDAVLALWLVILASELLAFQTQWREEHLGYVCLAAGLSILSKQTSYAFLLPFAVYAAILLVRTLRWGRALRWGLLAVLMVTILNAGMFSRNLQLYGHPIGPQDRFGQHANNLFTPAGLTSNLVRNLTLHLGTPSPYPNKAIALAVIGLHDLMGLDVNDPRTTAFGEYKVRLTSTHEDTAGNGLHMLLILGFYLALLIRRRDWPFGVRYLAVCAGMGFVLFSLLYKWLMFGSRLQLPFFLIFAPILGWWLSRWKPVWSRIAVSLLFAACLPWLLSLDSRPLIPNPNRSFVGSILTTSRRTLTFANGLYLLDPMAEMVESIKAAGCREVGILLEGNSVEYPLWVLLDAQEEGVHIEWIVAGTPSAQLEDPAFEPCAVICENCPQEWSTIRGLPLVYRQSVFSLYHRCVGSSP